MIKISTVWISYFFRVRLVPKRYQKRKKMLKMWFSHTKKYKRKSNKIKNFPKFIYFKII